MVDKLNDNLSCSMVIFDLDGVLADTISSWVYLHEHFGVNNDSAYYAYMRNEIDDHEFMRRDIRLWLNIKPQFQISELTQILDTIPLMPGFYETMATLKERKVDTAIVSAGLEQLATRAANEGGIEHVLANGLETDEDGYLTGDGILRVELRNKGKVVKRLLEELDVNPANVVAVGNGEIDITMFEQSSLGIAFDPVDDNIRKHADIVIENKDLTEILNYF